MDQFFVQPCTLGILIIIISGFGIYVVIILNSKFGSKSDLNWNFMMPSNESLTAYC